MYIVYNRSWINLYIFSTYIRIYTSGPRIQKYLKRQEHCGVCVCENMFGPHINRNKNNRKRSENINMRKKLSITRFRIRFDYFAAVVEEYMPLNVKICYGVAHMQSMQECGSSNKSQFIVVGFWFDALKVFSWTLANTRVRVRTN